MLEEYIQAIKSERDANEHLVAELKSNVSADLIELKRLKTLLDTEKSKVRLFIFNLLLTLKN